MTDTTKPSTRPVPEEGVPAKKPYEPPRVVSHNMLEVVTAVCAAPTGKATGVCGMPLS